MLLMPCTILRLVHSPGLPTAACRQNYVVVGTSMLAMTRALGKRPGMPVQPFTIFAFGNSSANSGVMRWLVRACRRP